MSRRWDLDDLASASDLADEYGTNRSTISNWASRYDDFPAPLVELRSGPVWSRRQVRAWHDARTWHTGRQRGVAQPRD